MPAGLAEKEAAFARQFEDLLRLYGWSWYHTYDSRRSAAGFPDYVCYRLTPPPERLFLAELKRETGRVTPAQWRWHDALHRCGLRAYLWRPSDLEQIRRVLAGEAW